MAVSFKWIGASASRLGLGSLPQELAGEIFEQAVNMGMGGAGKLLQRMCNAFNYDKSSGGPLFTDLVEDGANRPDLHGGAP